MSFENLKKRLQSITKNNDNKVIIDLTESNFIEFVNTLIEHNSSEIDFEILKMTNGEAKNIDEYFDLKNSETKKFTLTEISSKYVLLSLQNNLLINLIFEFKKL
ncbi:hypothetical protein [Chryseobacterium taklimakanense]|uniref:Uncharacterized protein n=1 Tax=Chryseobacterium taklimakanense TaxID=536441 RepID=A0A3G8WMF7_9FLAO|nr:hypothetical protein [Chryseobacterium taklimakanense]AZI20657.1 hypothetical protein EIH08_07970 [Chryseobacterium taklimakanense]